MKVRAGLAFSVACSLLLFAFWASSPASEPGATPKEKADAVRWASEEPASVAKSCLPGVDYPAVVRRCLARDQESFRQLFALSACTDAAASEMQSGILAIVLKQVGDDFFAVQLAKTPVPAREGTINLLRYELLEQTPAPYGMNLKHYLKTTRLLKK